nr:PREDICTED: tRNA-dihydrouridine(20) synthase [NAD(P)+]-like [Bemisia tabaci]
MLSNNGNTIDYRNKLILAPMVRIGTLPIRLLSIDYGADLVYSEEIIDHKLLRCNRRVNDVLKTVDYIDRSDGTIVFRTCAKERSKVILQLGTSDPDRALKAAKLLENDVAGVDVNMGCPKEFSIKGGMGAALLSNPDKACSILKNLVRNLAIPVTCKIRVLDTIEETVELSKKLSECGIAALAVHGRMRHERPQHSNRNDFIKKVSEVVPVPLIANGGSKEIETFSDFEKFKTATGCSSVMVARAAEWNCSIFRPEGKLPLTDVIKAYLHYAIDYDNAPANCKYCIQNMLQDLQETEEGKALLKAQTLEQISAVWGLDNYYRLKEAEYRAKGILDRWEVKPINETKRRKVITDDSNSDGDTKELRCAFIRNLYPADSDLPKTRLMVYARRKGLEQPKYISSQSDKLFKSIVVFNNQKYSSSYWEKNRRWAEQTAALVCLCYEGVIDKVALESNGSIK